MAPMAQLLVACALPIHAVVEAFRTGDGVPYADYGADLHEGQARFTQPMFDTLLATDWFPSVPAIHDRLEGDPPARVADVACGLGRSSIAIARGYPKVTVDGIDLDRASIAQAQRLLPESGVDDRVAFHRRDAADPELSGRYDLVTIFEALHDMSYPVDVLRAARGLLAEGGRVLVADERTAERFALDAGDIERLYYGFSVLHCLPVGMVGENAAGTGTVIREDTVRGYAEQAGFAGCEVAPVENDFWPSSSPSRPGAARTGWNSRTSYSAEPDEWNGSSAIISQISSGLSPRARISPPVSGTWRAVRRIVPASMFFMIHARWPSSRRSTSSAGFV